MAKCYHIYYNNGPTCIIPTQDCILPNLAGKIIMVLYMLLSQHDWLIHV